MREKMRMYVLKTPFYISIQFSGMDPVYFDPDPVFKTLDSTCTWPHIEKYNIYLKFIFAYTLLLASLTYNMKF